MAISLPKQRRFKGHYSSSSSLHQGTVSAEEIASPSCPRCNTETYGIYSAIKPAKETPAKHPRKRRRPLPKLATA
jgi:hypothetical protein